MRLRELAGSRQVRRELVGSKLWSMMQPKVVRRGSRIQSTEGAQRLRLKKLGGFRLRRKTSTASGVRTETEGVS